MMHDRMEGVRRLEQILAALGRRLRLRDGVRLAAYTLWLALLLAVLVEAAARLWPLPDRHLWAAVPLEIWLISLAIYSLLRPLPSGQIARRVDREFSLKDRLATALELNVEAEQKHAGLAARRIGQPSAPPVSLRQFQLSDALAAAQRLRPGALAWRLPRRPLWLAGALLLLAAGLALAPNPMDGVLAERAAIREEAAAQARAIEEARRDFAAATGPSEEERAEALRALAELMKALAANPGDREQALADLSAAQEKLQALQSETAAARQSAAEQIATQLTALSRGEARRSNDLGQAGQALTELAAALGNANAADRNEAAEALESMAAQAAAADADLAEALLDLASALRAGDMAETLNAANTAQAALNRTGRELDLQQALAASQAKLENSRQQLAGAGLPDSRLAAGQGQSPGQGQNPGQGQSQGPGQGQGQGQQVGGGGGTQADQLPGATRSGAARAPNQPNRPASTTGAEQIYAPGSGPHQAGNPEFVAGRETGQGQVIVREEAPGQGAANPGLTPYRDVYQSYAASAAEAMERERIPPEWKAYVRDYFSQLAPE